MLKAIKYRPSHDAPISALLLVVDVLELIAGIAVETDVVAKVLFVVVVDISIFFASPFVSLVTDVPALTALDPEPIVMLIVPPEARPVNCDPSTAGSFALPSS